MSYVEPLTYLKIDLIYLDIQHNNLLLQMMCVMAHYQVNKHIVIQMWLTNNTFGGLLNQRRIRIN